MLPLNRYVILRNIGKTSCYATLKPLRYTSCSQSILAFAPYEHRAVVRARVISQVRYSYSGILGADGVSGAMFAFFCARQLDNSHTLA
jgi:hypothetical protein